MGFYLEAGEAVDVGIKRIAQERLEETIYLLREAPQGRDKAVHKGRKSCKRIRAVLRLVRGALGEELYQQENMFYRDVSRRLAPVRDSAVIIETLDKTLQQFGVPAEKFAHVRAQLVARYEQVTQQLLDEEDVMGEMATALESARERIAQWPIEDSFASLETGLGKIYKQGRRGIRRAYQTHDEEDFHDWRKRVKYLWYHLEILQNVWPSVLWLWIDELHNVSDFIGDAHDLVELKRILVEDLQIDVTDSVVAELFQLMDARQISLERSAEPLGRRLYVESELQMLARLSRYWQVWRIEEPDLHPQKPEPPVVTKPIKWLGTGETAVSLNTTPRQVRKWIQNGTLPAIKIGRQWAIQKQHVNAMKV